MKERGPVCHRSLRRYWIEFESGGEEQRNDALPPAVGVTAESFPAALELTRRQFGVAGELPATTRVVEDVDVSTLDPHLVLSRAGPSALRGVWFPVRG